MGVAYLPPVFFRLDVVLHVTYLFLFRAVQCMRARVFQKLLQTPLYGWMCQPFQQRRKHLDLQRQQRICPFLW